MKNWKNIEIPQIDGYRFDFREEENEEIKFPFPKYSDYSINKFDIEKYIKQREMDLQTGLPNVIDFCLAGTFLILCITVFLLFVVFDQSSWAYLLVNILTIVLPIILYYIYQFINKYLIDKNVKEHYDIRIELYLAEINRYVYYYNKVRTNAQINKTYKSTNYIGFPVDLGLSVLWSSCNIGAEAQEDYGSYFEWGTIKPVKYTTAGMSNKELIKYGITDEFQILKENYDAASYNWGFPWRMPTYDEMNELFEKCEWKWTNVNKICGYKIIGPNGNYIFMPAAGFRYEGCASRLNNSGYYWVSQLKYCVKNNMTNDFEKEAVCMYFTETYCEILFSSRWHGCPVRAVADKGQIDPVEHLYIDLDWGEDI